MPWQPPAVFDDFEVTRYLGAGGMGCVYLARDRLLDRPVAIKFVSPDAADPAARDRFPIEARAVARLQHPNIVAAFRVGTVDGHPYLASEYVDGRRLDRLPRPMPWQRVLAIGVGLARGLAAAHHSRVLHRDIKPANIMITGAGEVKLLDFGMAKFTDAVAAIADEPPPPADDDAAADQTTSGTDDQDGLTRAGTVLGTPLYLAPERWQGMAADERSDLYALGVVLYELLIGVLPFARYSGPELVRVTMTRDMPSLGEQLPLIPRPLTRMIDRLVQRSPAVRPASAAEVRDGLEALAALYRPFIGDDGDDREAELLAASFARVNGAGDGLATRFYEVWFAQEPEVRPLFRSDPGQQRRMLTAALRLAIDNLRSPERLVPLLEDLGRRHAHYDLGAHHFGSMGRALIGALAELDPEWGDELARAWTGAFGRIARVVQVGMEQELASQPRPVARASDAWDMPLAPPRTRWTEVDGAAVSFQVFGHGTTDILFLGEWVTDCESLWDQPGPAKFLRCLAAIGRVVVFDRRGCGLSQRGGAPTLDRFVDDALAVLDAASIDCPVVVGAGDGGIAAALLAATHPARVRGLVLLGCGARMISVDDERGQQRLARAFDLIRARWGTPLFVDELAPSLAHDEGYRRWWAATLRRGASRADAESMLAAASTVDIAAVAPTIHAPTLLVHRRADPAWAWTEAQRLAGRIPAARLHELPGSDHVPWSGDVDAVVAAIQSFIQDVPTATIGSSFGATVLAVRLHDDRPQAAVFLREALRRELALHRGVPLHRDGEFHLASFDSADRAVRCARAVAAVMRERGHSLTIGVDTGELLTGLKLAGPVVDAAIALAAEAGPGEVRVGHATRSLIAEPA